MAARSSPAQSDKTLRVWDLASGETVRTLSGHTGAVRAVAVTPDGRHAVSGSGDNTLRVWDLASGETVRTLSGHTGAVTGGGGDAGRPPGRLRLRGQDAAGVGPGTPARAVRTLSGHTSAVNAVAVTPDGRHAVSGSDDNTLRVWDLAQRRDRAHPQRTH